jgi:hypothetical protein
MTGMRGEQADGRLGWCRVPDEMRCYWFEVFECVRKIALVGLPVIFRPGSVEYALSEDQSQLICRAMMRHAHARVRLVTSRRAGSRYSACTWWRLSTRIRTHLKTLPNHGPLLLTCSDATLPLTGSSAS